jgi:hypothetical protein
MGPTGAALESHIVTVNQALVPYGHGQSSIGAIWSQSIKHWCHMVTVNQALVPMHASCLSLRGTLSALLGEFRVLVQAVRRSLGMGTVLIITGPYDFCFHRARCQTTQAEQSTVLTTSQGNGCPVVRYLSTQRHTPGGSLRFFLCSSVQCTVIIINGLLTPFRLCKPLSMGSPLV